MNRSACACIAFAASLAATQLALADDQADVKAVAMKVVTALTSGDHATITENFSGTGVDKQMADTMSDVITASKALHEASVAKFGETAASPNTLAPERIVDQVNHSTVEVTGDKAKLIGPGEDAKGKDGMQLQRLNGTWKVTSLSSKPTPSDGIMLKILTAMAGTMKETAGEVTAGKYASAADVDAATRTKVLAAMKAQGLIHATTRPAGAAPPASAAPSAAPSAGQ